jgi:hypothetical protein
MMPLWLVALLSTAGDQDASTWFMLLFTAAAYIAYISLAGSWSWAGIYLQRSLPLFMVAGAFVTRPRILVVSDSPAAAELRLVAFALALYFIVKAALALIGRRSGRGELQLGFPLRGGTFMVGQGGSTRTVNRHAGNQGERYAVDVVKLGRFGMRADGVYPVALKKYAIFGDEVVSPCAGLVTAAIEDLSDNIPGEPDGTIPAGNHVAIETESGTIFLAHLMKNSVTVNVGQRVRAGQVIGRVGNSGYSSEPHLHIHAEKAGRGIPMRFNGRFLVRNDCVDA